MRDTGRGAADSIIGGATGESKAGFSPFVSAAGGMALGLGAIPWAISGLMTSPTVLKVLSNPAYKSLFESPWTAKYLLGKYLEEDKAAPIATNINSSMFKE